MMDIPNNDDFSFMNLHEQQKQYLYVRVVKAKDLPAVDVTGRCDPYVEVRLGTHKERARHFENKQNPEWNRVFAFSIDKIDATMLEVSVEDKDSFMGWVLCDLCVVPKRLPSDSPITPKWYKLKDRIGEKIKGELMLSVWWGTQADEAFREVDSVGVAADDNDGFIINHQSKVYMLPRLWYVRVHVIEGKELIPHDRNRIPEIFVKASIGNRMTMRSKISMRKSVNPIWNEDLMFVAAEPFEELLIVSVEDHVAPGKDEVLGTYAIPLVLVERRFDKRTIQSRWFNLQRGFFIVKGKKMRQANFDGKIHMSICLEGGYHVLHENLKYMSDFRPAAKQLWKKSIGILELGILSANGLSPTTDAYCVAKYGTKWIRTRTIKDSLNPRWNEQYTWEVLDPCTVLTIGVFDNNNHPDPRIGEVRIRISTLETDRIYTHSYPLFVLHPFGVKKMGEIRLAMRFTCSSMLNMIYMYSQPRFPEMNYIRPFTVHHLDILRHYAAQIVSMRLSQGESPLRKEVVEYMLDVEPQRFSLRRSKANFLRLMMVFSGLVAAGRWATQMHNWKKPSTMVFIHIILFIWAMYLEYTLSFVFLYLSLIGVWNYRWKPRQPPHMDTSVSCADNAHPDELDEEFDKFPTSYNADAVCSMRYDRLRSICARIQTVVGDIATIGEKLQSLLSWRDPMATSLFLILCLIAAIVLYAIPFYAVAIQTVIYVSKPSWLKNNRPSVLSNFYSRLPDKTDQIL